MTTAANPDDTVTLQHPNGKSLCTVHMYGATVISWICNGEEMLFVSSKSLFNNKKAIRGGIPLVFPCFGPWEHGPQHGFARITRWSLMKEPSRNDAGDVCAIFTMEDNEETRKAWNHKFQLEYKVTLTETSLTTDFSVCNKGVEEFDFTCLLHTYLKVPDVTKCTVSGLNGLPFLDKVAGEGDFHENRELVTVGENVDRIYQSTPISHTVTGVAAGRSIDITKNNLPDTVLWNPWAEKAAAMSDFGDDEYHIMLCVEAGHVTSPMTLSAQQSFHASQTMMAKL